jgi:hypothetical protein
LTVKMVLLITKERMVQSGIKVKNGGLSGLQVWRGLESCHLAVKLRHIVVPVDLIYCCPTRIDNAICFAGTLMK